MFKKRCIHITLFFFIRTSKFCLRLAVLNFFIFEAEMFLICSYFPDWTLQCHKEECQTKYDKNALFHFFHFILFHFFHISFLSFFIKVVRFKSATLIKLNSFTGILHRFWTQMQLYTLQISYYEEHIFQYFCRTPSMAAS